MFARLVGTFTKGYWSILVIAIVTVSNALATIASRASWIKGKSPSANLITALIETR